MRHVLSGSAAKGERLGSLLVLLVFGVSGPLWAESVGTGQGGAAGGKGPIVQSKTPEEIAAERKARQASKEKEKAEEEQAAKKSEEEQKKAAEEAKKEAAARANDPAYKEKVKEAEARIKELFQNGELKYKEKRFREAASFYRGVVLSNLPKTDGLVSEARKRLLSMDDLAKEHLNKAEDATIQQDYLQAIENLSIILREFPDCKVIGVARDKMVALKTLPKVAGLVLYAEAEEQEVNGSLLAAQKKYRELVEGPRYENTLPAMKAKRKLLDFEQNAALRERLAAESKVLADKEAPKLISAAKNYLKNQKSAIAKEKLQEIVERFPDTNYAEEAKQLLQELN